MHAGGARRLTAPLARDFPATAAAHTHTEYRNEAGYIITGSKHHQAGGAQRVEGAPEGTATGRHGRGGAPVKR